MENYQQNYQQGYPQGYQQGYQQGYNQNFQQAYSPNNQQGQYYPKPDNNLVLAIVCTACCCLPAGIYAIVRANDVNSLYSMGKYAEAQKAASDAKKWSWIGIIASIVMWILYGIFYLVVFGLAIANS